MGWTTASFTCALIGQVRVMPDPSPCYFAFYLVSFPVPATDLYLQNQVFLAMDACVSEWECGKLDSVWAHMGKPVY